MRRRRRLTPKPEPPDGMMFGGGSSLLFIKDVEKSAKDAMGRAGTKWSTDPSYFWADKLREKKTK